MSLTPSDITRAWADLLIDELVRCGVDVAVLSPGSRSTLLVAACVRNPAMTMRLHPDERGAAFFALGRARATGRPTAWITTSGTAAANGLPAVVEASVDGVPLVLLTADRPHELRDAAANQTFDQASVFAPYVRWRVDLQAPDAGAPGAWLLTTVDQAVYRAAGSEPGPVHLNVPFRKPLEPPPGAPAADMDLGTWTEGREPYTRYAPTVVRPDTAPLVEALRGARRPMIVAGRMDRAQADEVLRLARATGWPVAADVTSQLLLGGSEVLRHLDLTSAAGDRLPAPDAVLEIGRPGVSARLRSMLAGSGAEVRAVVAEGPSRIDPEHMATHRLQGILPAVSELADMAWPDTRDWAEPWLRADRAAGSVVDEFLAGDRLTEPAVARHVSAMLPEGHGLWLASSMAIRDMNTFASPGKRPVLVAANRGVSGIDGTLASAAGLSDGLGGPVTVVIGDLAFLHDLNALALMRDRPVTIVLLNNDGGGIFSFLPIAEHADVFEPWFTAPHGLRFGASADQFGLGYEAPGSSAEFRAAYGRALAGTSGTVIEIGTNRDDNRRLHDAILDEVVRRIGAS